MKSALWPNVFKGWNKTESETVLTLKSVPVFKGFTDKEFSELEQLIHRRVYKPEEYVFKNQAPGEGMYIIVSGGVKISIGSRHGKEQVLAELTAGDFFGEETILFDTDLTGEYRSGKGTKLFEIPADAVSNIPAVMWKLLEQNEKITNVIAAAPPLVLSTV